MEAITLPIYNLEGKEIESLKLNSAVFDGVINKEALHQAIVAYRAAQRTGLAATKTRGEVSGGGKKPWQQKGTGRARVGSIRSPLWRHGGVVFGPHPRDFSYSLPHKIKVLALKSALCAKVKENNFIILENFILDKVKTKEAVRILAGLKLTPKGKRGNYSALLLLNKLDDNLKRSLRNIGFLDFNLAKDTHAYEILSHRKLVITRDGLNELTNRLKK